jgi:hypothetical protein
VQPESVHLHKLFFGGGNSAAPPEFWQLKAVVNALQAVVHGKAPVALVLFRSLSTGRGVRGGGREERVEL